MSKVKIRKILALPFLALFFLGCSSTESGAEGRIARNSITDPALPGDRGEAPKAAQALPGIPTEPAPGASEYAAALEDFDSYARIYRANIRLAELGRLAEKQGASSWVRAFGRRLRLDSEFALGRLLESTAQMEVPDVQGEKPAQINEPDIIDRLSRLNGSRFDRQAIILARTVNAEALQVLDAVKAVMPRDSALNDYARLFIPILQQHGAVAERVMTRQIEESEI